MLLSWFDASEAKQCGLALAATVVKGYPASDRKNGKKAVQYRAKVLDQVFAQARQFKQTHNPNIYKKAKLGNIFKWALLEGGFEAEFVDDLTHQVLVQMK